MSTKATMTRQHFQLIAEVLREAIAHRTHNGGPVGSNAKERAHYLAQVEAIKDLASDFAARLASTNNGFRRDQFLAATDPETEYKPKRVSSNQHRSSARSFDRSAYSNDEVMARMDRAYARETLDLGAEGSEE